MSSLLNRSIFWLLSPLFLIQAVYLRLTVPRLPEPRCPRNGKTGSGRSLRVLVVGDSAGAGVGCPSQNEALTGQICRALSDQFEICWTIFAKTGWTTQDLLENLQQIPPRRYDVVVTSLGVNDVTGLVSSQSWILMQEVLVWRLRQRFERPLICLSGLPPVGQFPALPQPLRWWMGRQAEHLSSLLRSWCQEQEDCEYIHLVAPFTPDMMATDGFHPGPEVCKIWGDLVAQAIRRKVST